MSCPSSELSRASLRFSTLTGWDNLLSWRLGTPRSPCEAPRKEPREGHAGPQVPWSVAPGVLASLVTLHESLPGFRASATHPADEELQARPPSSLRARRPWSNLPDGSPGPASQHTARAHPRFPALPLLVSPASSHDRPSAFSAGQSLPVSQGSSPVGLPLTAPPRVRGSDLLPKPFYTRHAEPPCHPSGRTSAQPLDVGPRRPLAHICVVLES